MGRRPTGLRTIPLQAGEPLSRGLMKYCPAGSMESRPVGTMESRPAGTKESHPVGTKESHPAGLGIFAPRAHGPEPCGLSDLRPVGSDSRDAQARRD